MVTTLRILLLSVAASYIKEKSVATGYGQPRNATHLSQSGAYADLNFPLNTSAVAYTNEVNLAIDGKSTTIILTPTALPSGTGIKFCFLLVKFFEEVGGVQYVLKEGKYQGVRILGVM